MEEKNFISIISDYFKRIGYDSVLMFDPKGAISISPEWFADPQNGKFYRSDSNSEIISEYLEYALIYKYKNQQFGADYLSQLIEYLTKEKGEEISQEDIKKQAESQISRIDLRLFKKDGSVFENPSMYITGLNNRYVEVCTKLPDEPKSHQISLEQFYEYIVKGREYVSHDFSFSDQTRGMDIDSNFTEIEISKLKKSLERLAENFTHYYDHLIESKNFFVIDGATQGHDEHDRNVDPPVGPHKVYERHEIPEMTERRKILATSGLSFIGVIKPKATEEEKEASPCDVYMSSADDKKGRILWLEPRDSHFIRISYCTPESVQEILKSEDEEEIDAIQNGQYTDEQCRALANYFYSMSNDRFKNEGFLARHSKTGLDWLRALSFGLTHMDRLDDIDNLSYSGDIQKIDKNRFKKRVEMIFERLTKLREIAEDADPEKLSEAEAVLNGEIELSQDNGKEEKND